MARIYVELTDSSETNPNNLLAIMLRQRHRFNPDFEPQYTLVAKWHVEVEEGRALREIGLDANGVPVVIGPFGRNDGLWASMPLSLGSPHEPRIAPNTFQRNWDALASSLKDKIPPKIVEPVQLAADASVLEGVWTNGCQGSMSDDTIAFFANGRGYLQGTNGGAMWYDSFRWRFIEPGYISIEGEQFFHENDEGEVAAVPSPLQLLNVRAETEVKHFGDSSAVKFLYLRAVTTENWHPPDRLYFPGSYYRCPVQPAEPRFPEFHI